MATAADSPAPGGVGAARELKMFMVEDLRYEFTLAELSAAKTKFLLMRYYLTDFSLVEIMPVEVFQEERIRLEDEINSEVVDYPDEEVSVFEKDMVVLAPKDKDDGCEYYRAVICEITDIGLFARVYFVDYGGSAKVEVAKLRPVTEIIMSFPRLIYTVKLADVPETSNFILLSDFETKMHECLKTELNVVPVNTPDKNAKATPNVLTHQLVRLTFEKSKRTIDLANIILELGIWEWESLVKPKDCDNDAYVCANGAYNPKKVAPHCKNRLPLIYPLMLFECFTAEVGALLTDPKSKEAIIYVVKLKQEKYVNIANVLGHQLTKYAETVKPSPFYPAIDQFFLLHYKSDTEETGHWTRAIRVQKDLVFLIDFGKHVLLSELVKRGMAMRRLYMEFLKIPTLAIPIRIKYLDGLMSYDMASSIFSPGSRFSFRVRKTDETCELFVCTYHPVVNDEDRFLYL